ncbi:MAG: type II toxin-antitoxin system RelB/DinJ family antitoxin [Desulfovibrio sp.]|jgi:DNA-damage-inducible protein J|nr:type II toxin-antitoxin system RelB/DinJ family antitoxin [Desulfovibrio sp.]
MALTTNLNIRMERDVKEQAEQIFSDLGLTMTAAINLFLRAAIRERGIPFSLRLDAPNETTASAIEEGRRIASDDRVKGYDSMESLKAALEA